MAEYDLVRIFKALADKTRQDIFQMLGEEEMNVTDICNMFKISQPTISHHLQVLRDSNLVAARREGKNVYYCVKKEVVNGAFGTIIRKMHIRILREE